MQEMVELTKKSEEVVINPLHVQLLSHPYMGSLSLRGSPAQFGPVVDTLPDVS